MSKVKSILVEAFLPAIKAVGKAELSMLFAGIKEHHSAEFYQNTLRGLHADFSLLKDAAIKSRSRVDDGIVDLVLEAVSDSAVADGIVLS
jgi:hypothetical protein